MESTWETRDLVVLDAIVPLPRRARHDGPPAVRRRPGEMSRTVVTDVPAALVRTQHRPHRIAQAVRAIDNAAISGFPRQRGRPSASGLTAESFADRLVQGLADAAERSRTKNARLAAQDSRLAWRCRQGRGGRPGRVGDRQVHRGRITGGSDGAGLHVPGDRVRRDPHRAVPEPDRDQLADRIRRRTVDTDTCSSSRSLGSSAAFRPVRTRLASHVHNGPSSAGMNSVPPGDLPDRQPPSTLTRHLPDRVGHCRPHPAVIQRHPQPAAALNKISVTSSRATDAGNSLASDAPAASASRSRTRVPTVLQQPGRQPAQRRAGWPLRAGLQPPDGPGTKPGSRVSSAFDRPAPTRAAASGAPTRAARRARSAPVGVKSIFIRSSRSRGVASSWGVSSTGSPGHGVPGCGCGSWVARPRPGAEGRRGTVRRGGSRGTRGRIRRGVGG